MRHDVCDYRTTSSGGFNMKICVISENFLPVIGGMQYEIEYLKNALKEIGIFSYFVSKNIYKNIKKINPDVIQVHQADIRAFKVVMLKKLRLIKQPIVITSHGIDIMLRKDIGYGLRLKLRNRIAIRWILRNCDAHVLVSKNMHSYAKDAGSKSPIVIPNGIPLDRKPKEKRFSRSLLSLSGFRPLKGLDALITALALVKSKGYAFRLYMACKGDDREVRQLVKDYCLERSVKFLGFIKDEEKRNKLIDSVDILCKPSLLEATSIAVLEAMRAGKIVIGTEACSDIITDRHDGMLSMSDDIEEFARNIIRIFKYHDLRWEIEKNALETVKLFDIKKTATRYKVLYEKVIKSN